MAIFNIHRDNSGDSASRRAGDILASQAANCAVYADDASWAAKPRSSQPRLVNSRCNSPRQRREFNCGE